MYPSKTIDVEIKLLLEAIYNVCGYDFSEYSGPHIKRRVINRMRHDRLKSISQMQHMVLHEKGYVSVLLNDFSVPVTEMFRDPEFFNYLRREVIPLLKTHPFIKIWHAGCSTGEEVYSMAILLKEEGLLNKSRIYATDFNEKLLKIAETGIYPKEKMKEYIKNYRLSGGKESFSNYVTSGYDSAIIRKGLKKNIVWANHNLVTDSVFNDMNLILCRNVLIYFTKESQSKVLNLFHESLVGGGILCLGIKETLKFNKIFHNFKTLSDSFNVYQKNLA